MIRGLFEPLLSFAFPTFCGSDELDFKEVEVVNNSVGHQSSASPSQPPAKRFQSCLVPSTPRNVQPNLATIPTSLPPAPPTFSHTRPAMIPEVRPSPVQKSRTSRKVTSQQLQPESSSSERIEELSPLRFPAPRYFRKAIVGLSELPENIQVWRVKIKMLRPACLDKLIGIVGR
ncbi:hypothetical protein O181_051744 [Austropuccinia psidii MF-1]|uniref:Uncharacterized protein n=1 Tax=Austropuccinia psidii MF-1 TaxID=1389203 RepID=A0A9Q3DZB1_9BASI|nr:hypothetical protein [Austropuccinia psidii MF-1]